ncbi:MAG: hypothetical protein IJO63_05650 [Bacilli bacterium]|nr:hypothetical protein [Bacilli bacterium]
MVSNINSQKMKESASNIVKLATEYEMEITKLFKRFSEVPTVTKEWVGGEAEKYFNIVSFEKSDYMNVGSQLRSYAKQISTIADDFERQAKLNREDELGKGI